MIFKIAWRNLYRRPQRTFLVLMGIGVSIFCLILFLAMCEGMFSLLVHTVTDNVMGHIEIHHKDYLLKQEVVMTVKEPEFIIEKLKETEYVEGLSPRVVINGLVSSAESSGFAKVYGIDPEMEKSVTIIDTKLIRGSNLKKGDDKAVYIGEALADKLKIDIDDKMVIMARDIAGDMSGSAFRVKGIYSAGKDFEKVHVYITIDAAREMTGLSDEVHEIVIKLDDEKNLDPAVLLVKKNVGNKALSVDTWKDLSPVIVSQLEMAWIGYIILFAMVFYCYGIWDFECFSYEDF